MFGYIKAAQLQRSSREHTVNFCSFIIAVIGNILRLFRNKETVEYTIMVTNVQQFTGG